jgi:integrase
MASVRNDKGWLFLDFRFRGERCREFLNLRGGRDAQREANRIRRAVEAEIRAGSLDYARRFPQSPMLKRLGLCGPRSPTLGEVAGQWLEERAPHLSPSSRYWYRCLLASYLFPHPVAAKAIAEVSDADLNNLVRDLAVRRTRSVASVRSDKGWLFLEFRSRGERCRESLNLRDSRDGRVEANRIRREVEAEIRAGVFDYARRFPNSSRLSARTINAVLARLRTVFAVARRRKLIADDPTAYVQNLREQKPEVDPFDLREAGALLNAAQGWERSFLAVLLFAGLRPNEAFALRWEDIDFARGLILVRRNATRFGFGPPKTRDSTRDVPMLGLVRAALAEQRARSELRGELVFPAASGAAFDLADFRKRNWARIVGRAGVRKRALYQCRHTFARLLLERGENPQWIARALGHASVQMVFQVYGRWGAAVPESRALSALDADARGVCPVSAQNGGKSREGSGRLREAAQPMVQP